MTEWGLQNGHLEPFEFKTATVTPAGGWLNERASGHIVSPMRDNLVFEVLAWTPSTLAPSLDRSCRSSHRRVLRRPARRGAAAEPRLGSVRPKRN